MMRYSAVIVVLVFCAVMALERPEVMATCNALDCGASSHSCECQTSDEYECYPGASPFDARLVINEYNYGTPTCRVSIDSFWYCEGEDTVDAALVKQASGTPLAVCGGSCEGYSFSATDALVDFGTCVGGFTYNYIFIELRQNCPKPTSGKCLNLNQLLKETVKCYCEC